MKPRSPARTDNRGCLPRHDFDLSPLHRKRAVNPPMPIRTASLFLVFTALCASGCDRHRPAEAVAPETTRPSTPAPVVVEPPPEATATPPATTRSSRYSELKDCRLIEAKPDEAGYRLSECSGPAGHALRVIESDGRFNVMVQVPGGSFTSLRLSELGGGAFSQLGERIEWRGTGEGEAFVPDRLVLRYAVAGDPANPDRDTSYLVPVSLAGKEPCVAALIKPGPGQSDEARRIADAAAGCLARE
jgi:hypothetical protein